MNTIIKTKEIINIPEIADKSMIYIVIKRIMDILISIIGCIMLIPISIIICLINVASKDKGPVFYKHIRIGKNGKIFGMYKFRTMCNNAQEMVKDEETMKRYFTEEQIKEWKEKFKIENDPRITKLGSFLRRTSLDELPQFINVLKGDLALVGPRPIVEDELARYNENKDKFLSVTPGITGYWAANGRSNTSYEERMKMELYYVDNMSLKLDMEIILKTIVTVFKKKGAV